MPRPKKDAALAKSSAGSLEGMLESVPTADFVRIRDSVVQGLTQLQFAIRDLTTAYQNGVEAVLHRTGGDAMDPPIFPAAPQAFMFAPGPTEATHDPSGRRKRAPHDKNAPKRALTPYFLYLNVTRPQLMESLGPGHSAKEVQEEGQRRWHAMTDAEKEPFYTLYQINLARYRKVTQAYKAGQPLPVISDEEARELYEEARRKEAASGGAKKRKMMGETTAAESDDTSSDTSSGTSDSSSEDEALAPSALAPAAKKAKSAVGSNGTKNPLPVAGQTPAASMQPDPILDPALMATSTHTPGAGVADKKEKKRAKKTETLDDDAAGKKKRKGDVTGSDSAPPAQLGNLSYPPLSADAVLQPVPIPESAAEQARIKEKERKEKKKKRKSEAAAAAAVPSI